MKNLLFFAAVLILVGCSKETEFDLQREAQQSEQMSVDGSFDVGSIDANGNASITYDVEDLEELCACAVSESSADNLALNNFGGSTYYLTGIGQSTGSYTSFAIELNRDGDILSWVDNAEIMTCVTTASAPCTLDVQSESTYTCNNSAGTCAQTVIGGTNGAQYADCEYPWLIKKSGGK